MVHCLLLLLVSWLLAFALACHSHTSYQSRACAERRSPEGGRPFCPSLCRKAEAARVVIWSGVKEIQGCDADAMLFLLFFCFFGFRRYDGVADEVSGPRHACAFFFPPNFLRLAIFQNFQLDNLHLTRPVSSCHSSTPRSSCLSPFPFPIGGEIRPAGRCDGLPLPKLPAVWCPEIAARSPRRRRR